MLTAAALWRDTDAVVRRHFGALATLAAAFAFLPAALLRLMLPETMRMPSFDLATPPPPLPPGALWLLLALGIVQLFGVFAIAAVTADPSEGGGRTLGATIASALPALARFLGAMIVFVVAYIVAVFAFAIVVALIAGVSGVMGSAKPGGLPAAPSSAAIGIVLAMTAVILVGAVWLAVRLWPLIGVYLREPGGVIAGIRRAWALTRGRVRPLLGTYFAVLLVSLLLAVLQFALQRAAGPTGLAATLTALIGSGIAAVFYLYVAALTGIVYRRLA